MYKKILRTSVCLAIVTGVGIGTTSRVNAGLLDEFPETEVASYRDKKGKHYPPPKCLLREEAYRGDCPTARRYTFVVLPEHHPIGRKGGLGPVGSLPDIHPKDGDQLFGDKGMIAPTLKGCAECAVLQARYQSFLKIEGEWLKEQAALGQAKQRAKDLASEEAELKVELLKLQIAALKKP